MASVDGTKKIRMHTAQIIYGRSFIENAKLTDLTPKLLKALDPDGFTVVSFAMLHNDGPDMRLHCLFKLRNQEEPYEGRVTLRGGLFGKIVKTVQIDDDENVTLVN